MALIITLIMLSVTLIMAVAFLAISRRERNAVTTTTDTATARLAADAALSAAEAQIVANIFATTNAAAYNFGLLASTNYINGAGFQQNPASSYTSLTNVSYYYPNGNPLSANDLVQNIANLFYLPRVPVYMTNLMFRTNENRFYLDLNRNGMADANGWVTNVNNTGHFILDSSGNPIVTLEVGDPEWIGLLERPDIPHGPNNLFVSRYAFIAVPVGNTLDINAIHNEVFDEPTAIPSPPISVNPGANLGANNDGFFRNEGVGSWEINLAAFLADLNTNEWGQIIGSGGSPPLSANYYQYNEAPFGTWSGGPNAGVAFDDARALLAYRYNNDYNTLASVLNLYDKGLGLGGPGPVAFVSDGIDGYSDGPLMNRFILPVDTDNPQLPWAGADNTNQFFTQQDLFDTSKTAEGVTPAQIALGNDFSDRLLAAGTNTFGGSTVPTYDRYTFYRLLAELGSDSTPDAGKINLNYSNVVVQTDLNGLVTNLAIVPEAETNFAPWLSTNFFLAAANQMLLVYTTNWFQRDPSNYLLTYYGIATNYYFTFTNSFGDVTLVTNDPNGLGLTNIPFYGMTNEIPVFGVRNVPVLVNGRFVYSPAVNRVLQLAANIYDATTNSFYPHVFRPTFDVVLTNGYTNVFINSYQEVQPVNGAGDVQLALPVDVTTLPLGLSTFNYPNGINVYGVPWIIGAKKGFPNFNEFSMEDVVRVTRNLQVTRNQTNTQLTASSTIYQTNQMYLFSITNNLGVECWNSYTNYYLDPVQIMVRDSLVMALTNGAVTVLSNYFISVFTNVTTWPGSKWNGSALVLNDPSTTNPFVIPLYTNITFLPESVYHFGVPAGFIPTALIQPLWETNLNLTVLPQFGLLVTNRLQMFILDMSSTPNHVIDYVQLSGPDSARDINAELSNPDLNVPNGLWQTNLQGALNQLHLSSGALSPDSVPSVDRDGGQWVAPPVPGINTVPQLQAYFAALFPPNNTASAPEWGSGSSGILNATEMNLSLGTQAPYTPTRTMVEYVSRQANDPLVHYLVSDLNFAGTEQPSGLRTGITNWGAPDLPILPNIGNQNDRYQPWGDNEQMAALSLVDTNAYNLAYKDPLMWNSDYWQFPTNKFPGVGWLGRVHRGTPWQTVYLKAPDIMRELQPNGSSFINNGTNTWMAWTGDGSPFDAANSAPVEDRLLFDVFTTAFNDNATRGTLSVNQTHLAAWSALLSGMVVPTGLTNSYTVISPAGPAWTNSPLGQIVVGINNARANTNFFPLQVFEHVGDVLAVPQLTSQSPYLANLNPNTGINDEMYEWLPQQMMSLLRLGSPRYVIYCYGQALKPAPNSLVTSGAYFGMCTNYQVVAESAARAVVRVDGANTQAPRVVVESFNPLPPD